ncbi:Fur family transcriptional regulator [Carboxydothermus pertinax]|uniref:Transcriptional repressor n=1 Tax=Carboxydothermus pertinax TaxID=870242 RepID=A0A1L8CVS5_9THEO|nr:transcriptional repressor [Carboxydothermus pertinax]GAV22949.1 transcriptional repressor [Carboxydothermus pertinax]
MNIKEAVEILKEKGVRITPQRQALLKIFADNKSYTARQVAEFLRPIYPGFSYDTVYRNLKLFCQLGILGETMAPDGVARYSLNTGEHHHYFTCLRCGVKVALESCPMEESKIKLSKKIGSITYHRFELFGECKSCEEGKK